MTLESLPSVIREARATTPATGFGYVQKGAPAGPAGVSEVASFREKPDQATAERYLADGQFPPGSMGPKIESCLKFVRACGCPAVITNPPNSRKRSAFERTGHSAS